MIITSGRFDLQQYNTSSKELFIPTNKRKISHIKIITGTTVVRIASVSGNSKKKTKKKTPKIVPARHTLQLTIKINIHLHFLAQSLSFPESFSFFSAIFSNFQKFSLENPAGQMKLSHLELRQNLNPIRIKLIQSRGFLNGPFCVRATEI